MLSFENIRVSLEYLFDKYSFSSNTTETKNDNIYKSLLSHGKMIIPHLIILIDDYPHEIFNLLGDLEDDFKGKVIQKKNRGIVQAMILDVKKWYKEKYL